MRRHLARTLFVSFKSHPGCSWCDSGAGPRRAALLGDHLPVHKCRRACAEAEPTRRLHGLDAADLPAIRGRTEGDATRSHVQSVHVRAALPGIFRLFRLSMSSARADDMAWGWLLEMPPMRYSHGNAKIAIFLSHSAARNGACDALHDREGRVRAGDPLRYPHPPSPASLVLPLPRCAGLSGESVTTGCSKICRRSVALTTRPLPSPPAGRGRGARVRGHNFG